MTYEEAKEVLSKYPCVCQYGSSPFNCSDTECKFGDAIRTLIEKGAENGKTDL